MQAFSRRDFCYQSIAMLAMSTHCFAWPFNNSPINTGTDDIKGSIFKNDAPDTLWKWSKEAYHYKTLNNQKVVCGVCPNKCILSPGDRSVCRSRVNIKGKLYSLAYGNPCSMNIDPIEKKPLYHFKPQSLAFSIATTGCNFRCLNCQNWEISQVKPHEVRHYDLFPEKAVTMAKANNSLSIAYTYSEATTFFEYMIDIARIAKKNNIYNLWISNGYINPAPLNDLCEVLDAANVNLKSFSDAIYRKLNGGRLDPVLRTFKTLHEKNVHFEMTHLVVPGYVDDDTLFKQMCDWILNTIGPDYPLHLSRFFPKYKLDRLPPTPVATLTRFRDIAMKAGIHYVYIGNVPGHEGGHTYCHHCKKRIIERMGYHIPKINMNGDKCGYCGKRIPGRWGTA